MMMKLEKRVEEIRDIFNRSPYPVQYRQVTQEEQMLPVAPGIRLRTLIIKPVAGGKSAFPCVVLRSCYPHEEAVYVETARQYARRGFAYVIQFCRGTGGSEGVWEPNVNERADGKATIDWLCARPWVESVGYWGCSYLALTGWLIADILPDKVKTMYLTHYGTFRHVSAYQDGLFRHDVLTAWAMENAGTPVTADYLESCRYRPHAGVDEALWGVRLDWYRQWVTSTDATAPYWNEGVWQVLQEIPARVRVPLSISGGWFDHHLGSAIETYKHLSPECRVQSEFLIGAWTHWFAPALENDNGTHCENNDLLRAFAWFHRLLVQNEAPKARIATYLIGADRWTERETYAIEGQQTLRLFLSGQGGGQCLVRRVEQVEEGERCYRYDPEDPVPSHGAEAMLHSRAEIGSLLQQKPGYRPDVLSFVSTPFEEPLTVMGAIRVHLWVKSDAEDTCFVARIMDVRENGDAYSIRTGITTLAYRNKARERQEYRAGSMVEITIDTWDIAWHFPAGHCLRVDIQSSDFPQYAIHSNTPGVWSQQPACQPANQTLCLSIDTPSYVELPVTAAGCQNA